ncbi:Uma2 family endonuclease [Streptomyces apocyni]|uniref:Uma2 family endonuclease n=1 Tax=Streptomyces apocyni TaxID=2654677 RepID=UPI0012EA9938|nr:Uma2 family endonuclease [Streptomyces apocyni]
MATDPDEMPAGTPTYRAMREFVESTDGILPGTFEITTEGIVHDLRAPNAPDEFVAHTGKPDVEDPAQGILRRPDLIVLAWADMEGEGSFPPRTLIAAIEIVSRSNPDNDWVSKMRDYPLLGIPIYAVFDPRTGTGAVLSDIHSTPQGPRYATRREFVYGEDVTSSEWTISTEGLPRYEQG